MPDHMVQDKEHSAISLCSLQWECLPAKYPVFEFRSKQLMCIQSLPAAWWLSDANRKEAKGENSLRHKSEQGGSGIKATAWKSIPEDGIWHPTAAKQTVCVAMGVVSHAEREAGEHVAAQASQRRGRAFCKDARALTCSCNGSVASKHNSAALQRSCPIPKWLVSPTRHPGPVFWSLHMRERCRTGSFGEQQKWAACFNATTGREGSSCCHLGSGWPLVFMRFMGE